MAEQTAVRTTITLAKRLLLETTLAMGLLVQVLTPGHMLVLTPGLMIMPTTLTKTQTKTQMKTQTPEMVITVAM